MYSFDMFSSELCWEQMVWHGVHGSSQEGTARQNPGKIVICFKFELSLIVDCDWMQTPSNQLWNTPQRVIVIKHGELVAEAEMEEDLQNYLKMNTYLDSADPWFWPKLRFVKGQIS